MGGRSFPFARLTERARRGIMAKTEDRRVKDKQIDKIKKAAPREMGKTVTRLIRNKDGWIRTALAVLMALCLYALCVPGAEWLYWTGFNALMRLWGVTDRNIARAPLLVRLFARYSGVLLTLVQSALLFGLSRRVMKAFSLDAPEKAGRGSACARGALCGAGSLLVLWILLLLIDNMRLGRSLLRPAWSVNAVLLPVTLAATAGAGLCWGLGLLYRLFERSLPEPFAVALGALLLAPVTLGSAHIDAMVAVNTLLCGAVLCLSVKRKGSRAWAFGFLCAVWILERAALGFPGYAAALYETYPVNYYWLNGGERGLWHGAAMTALLLCQIMLLIRPFRRRSAS